jgi:hypothetical protein
MCIIVARSGNPGVPGEAGAVARTANLPVVIFVPYSAAWSATRAACLW